MDQQDPLTIKEEARPQWARSVSLMDFNVQGHGVNLKQEEGIQGDNADKSLSFKQNGVKVRKVSLIDEVIENNSSSKAKKSAGIMESSGDSHPNQQQVRHTSSIDAPFNSMRSQQQDSNFAENQIQQNHFRIEQIQQPDSAKPIEEQITTILKAIDTKQQNSINKGLHFIIQEFLSEDAQAIGYYLTKKSSQQQNQSEFPPISVSRSQTINTKREFDNNTYMTQYPQNIHQCNELQQSQTSHKKKETRSLSKLQYRLPSDSITYACSKIHQNQGKSINQTNMSSLTSSRMRKQNFRYYDFNFEKDVMTQQFAQTQRASRHYKNDPKATTIGENDNSSSVPQNNYLWTSYPVSNDMLFKQSCDKPEQILENKRNQIVKSFAVKDQNYQTQLFLGSSLREDPGGQDLENAPMQFSASSKEAQIGQESLQASITPSKGTQNNNYNEYVPDQFSFHQLNHNQESIFSQSPNHRPERFLYPFQNASETDIKISNVTASAPIPTAHFKQKNNKYKTLKIEIKDFLDDVDAVEDIQDFDESGEKNQIQTMNIYSNKQNLNAKSNHIQRSYSQHQQSLYSNSNFTQKTQQEIISSELQILFPDNSRNFQANQNLILQDCRFDTQVDNQANIPTKSNQTVTQQLKQESQPILNRHNRFKMDRRQQLRKAQERLRKRKNTNIEHGEDGQACCGQVDDFMDTILLKLEQFIAEQETVHQTQIDYKLFQRQLGEQIQKQIHTQIQDNVNQIIRQQLLLQEQKINDIDQLVESQSFLFNKQISELETKILSKITLSSSGQQQQPQLTQNSKPLAYKQIQNSEQIVNYLSTMESERTREQQGFKQRVENLISECENRVMSQIQKFRDQIKSSQEIKVDSQMEKSQQLEIVRQELLDVLATSQGPVIQRITIVENQLIELNKLIIELVDVQAKCQLDNQIETRFEQVNQIDHGLDDLDLQIEKFSSLPQQSKSKNLLQQTYTGRLHGSNLIPIEQNHRYNQSKSMNSPSQMQLIDSEQQINNSPQAFVEFQGSHLIELQCSDDIEKYSDKLLQNKDRIIESHQSSKPASSQIKRPHRLSKGSGAFLLEERKQKMQNGLNNSKIGNSLVSQNSKISNALNTSRHQVSLKQSQQSYLNASLDKASNANKDNYSQNKLNIDVQDDTTSQVILNQKQIKIPLEIMPLQQSAIQMTEVPECLLGENQQFKTKYSQDIKNIAQNVQNQQHIANRIQNTKSNTNKLNDIFIQKIEFNEDTKFPSHQIYNEFYQKNKHFDQEKSLKQQQNRSPSAMNYNQVITQNQQFGCDDINQEQNQLQNVQQKQTTRSKKQPSNSTNKNVVLLNESKSFVNQTSQSNSQSSQICSEFIKEQLSKKIDNKRVLILKDLQLDKQFTQQIKLKQQDKPLLEKKVKVSDNVCEYDQMRRSFSADFKLKPSKNSRSKTKQRLANQVHQLKQLEKQALLIDFQIKMKNLLNQNLMNLKDQNSNCEPQKKIFAKPTDKMPLKQRFQSMAYQKVNEHMQDHGLIGSKCPLLARAKTNLFQGVMKDKWGA